MTRKRLSTRDRLRCFEDGEGKCHICGLPIQTGEPWEVSHPRPLALGGEDTRANRRPAHKTCHAKLTAGEDIPRIAKAKRQRANHIGAKAPSPRPIQGRGFQKRQKGKRMELPPLPRKPLYEPKEATE